MTMAPARYLVDSDICIQTLRGNSASRTHLIRTLAPKGLAISVITYGEVQEGCLYSRSPVRNAQRWREFLAPFAVINITQEIAEVWAELRATLRARRELLPDADMLIAATALYFDMALVTGNLKHFQRISALTIHPLD